LKTIYIYLQKKRKLLKTIYIYTKKRKEKKYKLNLRLAFLPKINMVYKHDSNYDPNKKEYNEYVGEIKDRKYYYSKERI